MKYNRDKGCFEIPLSVNISVTEKCLLRCPFCFQNCSNVAELAPDIVCNYLDELASMGTKHVQFSGGEPLLYSPLSSVIAYAKRKGFITRIATSGVGIDEQLATQLLQSGLDYCHLSLNGSKACIHEITRDCFEGTMDALKLLREIKMPLVINWVANHSNVLDLPELIEMAKSYGVEYISVLSNKKSLAQQMVEPLTSDDISILKQIYKENTDFLSIESCFFQLMDNGKRNLVDSGCRAGRFYMAISARNEFSPCPHSVKTASQGSIMEYWDGNVELNKIRSEIKRVNEVKENNLWAPCK